MPRRRNSAPSNRVLAVMSEMLLLAFITNRLMEYRPLIVKMPDRMGWIPTLVCKKPVTAPARHPASTASASPRSGWPPTEHTAETAKPSVKLPSAVRSGMFRMRKLMNTPSAKRP